ncbi:GntR family transcriptional regulator [Gottschalkiaceae bacterium SANA]|nr:GntR family transcriptional regulator [Gottschalkiaceae bacterium SANA]
MKEEKAIDYQSPIYLQVRKAIRDQIDSGEFLPGMSIPSENELAELYGIHRLTVRNAISVLVMEGLLKSVKGKGVFVVGPKMERDLDTLGGFTKTMKAKGAQPSTKVLIKAIRQAGEKYAMIFHIRPENEIYYIKRICFADGEPVSLEEIYIPTELIPNFDEIDLAVFSIYEIYDFYGVQLTRADQTLDLTTLPYKDAKRLGIDPSDSVLLFSGTSYDENNRIIEFSRTYTRGDKSDFTVHFMNK